MGWLCLGIALGLLLIAARERVYSAQTGMDGLARWLPVSYAFGAGMVASVNPCGVLMLPSIVAFYLSRETGAAVTGWRRAGKALLLAAMATVGFVLLFAVVGAIVGAGGEALADWFPVGSLVVGVTLIALGGWLVVTGRAFGILAASRAMGVVTLRGDLRALFLFGVAYAITSLSCTLPIFLSVAGSALASGNLGDAIGQFIGYALGMGSVLTVVIVAAAFFQGAVQRILRRAVALVHRLSAILLLAAGVYLFHFGLASAGFIPY